MDTIRGHQPLETGSVMDIIFDIHAARLWEAWYQSHKGRAMDSFIENLIPVLLDPQPGERVLDIGCGSGNHLLLFNRLGLDITGVDASPYMISTARERLGDRCSLKTGMAQDLPFEDNEFDLAVLINTLEFLDDPLQALREAGRVAKRMVLIGVLNSFSWHYLYVKLQSLFSESPLRHARSYSLWEIKSYIQRAYGRVPITWRSAQIHPPYFDKVRGFLPEILRSGNLPFGSFLGLSAKIAYTVKADKLPLKVRVKKAEQSIVGGIGMKVEGVRKS